MVARDPSAPAAARRAVVIGASIAGLLAARVLGEHFAEVVVLERDALPDGAVARKGTPHAAHPHGLLARGLLNLEALFPGFTEPLLAQGALLGDIGSDAAFEVDRQRLARCETGHQALAASRLAIEAELRRRVAALPTVRLVGGVDVRMALYDPAARRVVGVRFARRADAVAQATEDLEAALVVDCSGRGSQSARWMLGWGYEPPVEERVHAGICYTSAYFRRDRDARPPLLAVFGAATPAHPRTAVLIAQESDADGVARWVAAVASYAGDHPEPTLAGLRERARQMRSPEVAAVVERGEPVGEVMRYAFACSERRRYEQSRRLPAGFLVMGDALASFNPVYGQGMTVASCEALALRDALARHRGGAPDARLAFRYFRAAARAIDVPWRLAVGADLALPMVPGPRPLAVRAVNRYVARLQRAALRDPVVASAFLEVIHMLKPPPALFAPRIAWRVTRIGRRARDVRAAAASPARPPM